MQFNESFWVAFSVMLFGIFVFKYIKKPLDDFLVDRARSIQNRINEALNLSKEAKSLLEQQQELHQNAAFAAEELLIAAQEEVRHMKKNAEKDLATKLELKKASILGKINTNEAKLLNRLRMESVQLAIAASISILHETGFDKINIKLIEDSMSSIAENF